MRALSFVVLVLATGCAGSGEGLEPSRVPAGVKDDYVVFARRCSKCHSLARPLQSGIDSDDWWRHYVSRMRAMPGSGISADDEVKILRFLRYYSAEQRKRQTDGAKEAP